MRAIYGEDLAHIQIAGFGAIAQAAGPQIVALLHEQPNGWLRRKIETFVLRGEAYRRGHETHHVRVFDREKLTAGLGEAGFDVQTVECWREYRLAPRRCAFVCRRR